MDGGNILLVYDSIISLPFNEIDSIGKDNPVPKIPTNMLLRLLKNVEDLLSKQTKIVEFDKEAIVVGDLHGNLRDLLKIFSLNGYPPNTNYIFLGDYVDRGDYSIECIILLFALLASYPDSIVLMRGNHEFEEINSNYGFLASVEKAYSSSTIWDKFNDTFNYLPLACIACGKYFLVHGGIPSVPGGLKKLEQQDGMITDFTNTVVQDLMWSDPTDVAKFDGYKSLRGFGHHFGRESTAAFLSELGLERLVRAHQCVDGVLVQWDGLCTTVFSSSTHGRGPRKACGYISISPDEFRPKLLPTGSPAPRVSAHSPDPAAKDPPPSIVPAAQRRSQPAVIPSKVPRRARARKAPLARHTERQNAQ